MRRGSPSPPTRVMAARCGFTLVEVIVALTLSAIVMLGARMLLESLSESAMRINVASRTIDANANAERLLRGLVGSIEVGTDVAATFGGDEQSVQFTTWCRVAAGWLERCRLVLEARQDSDGVTLTICCPNRTAIKLRRAQRRLELRYLADPGAGGTWLRRWGDGLTTPTAIGVLMDGDTLIVRIGDRG